MDFNNNKNTVSVMISAGIFWERGSVGRSAEEPDTDPVAMATPVNHPPTSRKPGRVPLLLLRNGLALENSNVSGSTSGQVQQPRRRGSGAFPL